MIFTAEGIVEVCRHKMIYRRCAAVYVPVFIILAVHPFRSVVCLIAVFGGYAVICAERQGFSRMVKPRLCRAYVCRMTVVLRASYPYRLVLMQETVYRTALYKICGVVER